MSLSLQKPRGMDRSSTGTFKVNSRVLLEAFNSSSAWLFLVVFAVLSVLVPFAFYFAGLQYLQPTNAIVVSCLEPVFSILIAAIVLHEVVRPRQALGILMVLLAIWIAQSPSRAVEPMD